MIIQYLMVLFLTTINLNPLTWRITQGYHGYDLGLDRRLEIEDKGSKNQWLKNCKSVVVPLRYFGQVFCCCYPGYI